MQFELKVRLSYDVPQPSALLLQIHAASLPDQIVANEKLSIAGYSKVDLMEADEDIGSRFWVHLNKPLECEYSAIVKLDRGFEDISQLQHTALTDIPATCIKYLLPSRYCFPDLFHDFVTTEFQGLSGGALILAMRDWLEANMVYDISASNSVTTAMDSFQSRRGICRDYAHILIAMARAVAIPARMVSVYGPGVEPQDFHAVVEVFLDGRWHLVDPTGMTTSDETIIIGVGRDAADISFLTSYGLVALKHQSVSVFRT